METLAVELQKVPSSFKKVATGTDRSNQLLKELGYTLGPGASRAQISELGEGIYGGTVYRIEEFDTNHALVRSRVLKKYSKPEWAQRDVQLMNRLSRLYAAEKKSNALFKVATYSDVTRSPSGASIVQVSDTRGRTLGSLFKDPQLGAIFKNRLRALYKVRAQKWVSLLKSHGYKKSAEDGYDTDIGAIEMIDAHNDAYILHYDQIIVDMNTFDMTIIDPL